MLRSIVQKSLFLAVLVLLEGSILPYWAGDFVLVFIYFWFLDFHSGARDPKEGGALFWLPIIIGLSIFNFKIDSLWMVLPYFILGYFMRKSFLVRSEWVFRAKEGFILMLLNLTIFFFLQIIINEFVLGYGIESVFWLRSGMSFVFVWIVWNHYYKRAEAKKIR